MIHDFLFMNMMILDHLRVIHGDLFMDPMILDHIRMIP